MMAAQSRRLVRSAALFTTGFAVERGISLARGKTDAWNFLTAGAVCGAIFGFTSGQLRRALLISGSLSIVGLPFYLALTTGWVDRTVDSLLGGAVESSPEASSASQPYMVAEAEPSAQSETVDEHQRE